MGSRPIGHPILPASRLAAPSISRGLRVALGLVAGVGATGISASLGVAGTFLTIDLPLIDPSALILMAPVIVLPAFAGAVLRGWAAVGAISAGAGASPIAFLFTIDHSCNANMFAGIAFVVMAGYAFVIAGAAASVADRFGQSAWIARNRGFATWVIVVVATIGIIGWIAAAPALDGCP
jgi:hypothetical protein